MMKWTRFIPFAAIAVAAPAALAGQDTIKPTTPPTQQQYPHMQMPAQDSTQQDSTNWNQQRTTALLKGITLTAEQQATVDSIQKKYKDQLPAHQTERQNDPSNPSRNDPSNPSTTQQPDSAQQSLLLMVLERQDTEVRAALKPDQQKIWDKNKQELKKQTTPVG